MTWRVSENAEGKVEMALLAAELGPGKYDFDDGVVAGRRRAPAADFSTGAAAPRFPKEDAKEDQHGTDGGEKGFEKGFSGSPFGEKGFDRVRPRTTIGGAMDRATRPVGDFADDSSPAGETPALYDVERGLAFLRKHARAADFASGSGSNPRAMDPSAADSSTGNPRDDARPVDFYPVDASVAASATGARGASRSSAADFARASRRGLGLDGADDDRRRGGVDFEFADGDVLYLLPETADDAVYPRRDRRVPDLARDLGRARAEPAPAGETTREVDYLRERHLARLYPRLDAGSGAVRLDAPRARAAAGSISSPASRRRDLDAGVYHDDAANVDARARRSGQPARRTSTSPRPVRRVSRRRARRKAATTARGRATRSCSIRDRTRPGTRGRPASPWEGRARGGTSPGTSPGRTRARSRTGTR